MMMPNDKTYIQARQIMLGKENIKPEFAPLAQWIDQTYGVKTVDIFYELPDSGKPRIQVCLEFEEDMEKFLTHSISYFDTSKQEAIAQKFKAVIEQQGLSEKTGFFSGLWGKPKSNTYSTDHVFVTYSAFEPAAKYEAASKISRQQIEEFMASLHHKDLWTISIEFFVPVFLYSLTARQKNINGQKPNPYGKKNSSILSSRLMSSVTLQKKTPGLSLTAKRILMIITAVTGIITINRNRQLNGCI